MKQKNDRQRLVDACQFLENKQYADALGAFSALLTDKVYEASTYLGYIYQHGLGTATDENRAVAVYRSGAEHGVERAKLYLAQLLYNKREYAEAVKWYIELYDNDNASAAYWLYICYRNGLGVVKDNNKGRFYLERSAKFGHLYALRDLSRCYLRGEYGVLGVMKGVLMTLLGICRLAFTIENHPEDDKLH